MTTCRLFNTIREKAMIESKRTGCVHWTFLSHAAVCAVLLALMFCGVAEAENTSSLVYPGADGRLVYETDALGNTIPDFSKAGYGGGGVTLPEVPVVLTVEAGDGEDQTRIQAAIDTVSALPAEGNGFRGAVLLKRGVYEIPGSIRIETSGVVLRGEGQGLDGTVLLGTGTTVRTLVQIRGSEGPEQGVHPAVAILDDYVPVGARSFSVASSDSFGVGDTIIVHRLGNQDWIVELGMDQIPPRRDGGEIVQWEAFNFDSYYDRVITAIEGSRITVDAPIMCAIETRWGGGEIWKYDDPGRIEHVGIENLRGDTEFDPLVTRTYSAVPGGTYYSDEAHAKTFISIADAKNAWVRDITAEHFWYAAIQCSSGSKWVTVQDSTCIEMTGVITGSRRYNFSIGKGQLVLVQRCYSDLGRHDYVVGSRVNGPNVFLYCETGLSFTNSEPHHRWSTGGLYDNVHADIALQNRLNNGSGHGWAGANYVAWNTEGKLVAQSPPTAQNWAIGHVGQKWSGNFPPQPDGIWDSHGEHVSPESLYLKQLEDRLSAEEAERSPSDVNSDNIVDAVDVQLVINAVLGHDTAYDCDVNGDNAVDAVDVQIVINAVLGV